VPCFYYQTVKREDLSGKAAKLKTESTTLLNQAQETERTLQGTKKETEMLAEHDKHSLNYDFSQLSKALQHIFNQNRLLPL